MAHQEPNQSTMGEIPGNPEESYVASEGTSQGLLLTDNMITDKPRANRSTLGEIPSSLIENDIATAGPSHSQRVDHPTLQSSNDNLKTDPSRANRSSSMKEMSIVGTETLGVNQSTPQSSNDEVKDVVQKRSSINQGQINEETVGNVQMGEINAEKKPKPKELNADNQDAMQAGCSQQRHAGRRSRSPSEKAVHQSKRPRIQYRDVTNTREGRVNIPSEPQSDIPSEHHTLSLSDQLAQLEVEEQAQNLPVHQTHTLSEQQRELQPQQQTGLNQPNDDSNTAVIEELQRLWSRANSRSSMVPFVNTRFTYLDNDEFYNFDAE